MAARFALAACVLTLWGCASHRAAPQAARPARPTSGPALLPVRVTDAASGRPLAAATVSLADTFPLRMNPRYRPVASTDVRGACAVPLPDPAGSAVYVKAHKAGFVPTRLLVPTAPTARPERVELAMEPGATFGGVVRNEDGTPVAGAEVRFEVLTKASPNRTGPAPDLGEVVARTGHDGRWSADVFPPGSPGVSLMISHPDYVGPFAGMSDVGWIPADTFRKRQAVSVLKRGAPLAGTVTDTEGRPLAGARVVLGFGAGWLDHPPAATTDAAGRYRFDHVGKGKMVVTASARGRAPDVKEVVVREDNRPVDFRLDKASTLRVRVVNSDGGAPIAGATVAAWMWRGRQNLDWSGRTGADGRLSGADLPADEVRFLVAAPGRMGREVALKPQDAEQLVKLHPALRVSGAVVDAETGRPVAPVQVVSGHDLGDGTGIRWDQAERTTARGGRYERTFDGALAGYQLRFVADGYVPHLSRRFGPDEGAVSFDVRLAPQRGPPLVVVGPDGKPAADVEVIAVGADHKHVTIQDGKVATTLGPDPDAASPYPLPSRSRAGGRVDIALPDGPYLLVAAGEAGYATLASDKVRADGETRIALRPWHRVVGSGLTGAGPKAGQVVTIRSDHTVRAGALAVAVSVQSTGITDAEGRFRIDKCVPGPAVAGRIAMRPEQFAMVPEEVLPFDIPEDQPEVELKGVAGARSVVATVIPPDDFPPDWAQRCMAFLQKKPPALPTPKGWLFMGDEGRQKWMEEFRETDAGKQWTREAAVFRPAMLGADGSVRMDDVRPGRYTLTVQAGEPRWGRLSHDFEVPPDGDAPIDLGRLELLPRFWPKPARPAPKPPAAE